MTTLELAIAFASLFVAVMVPFGGAVYWIGRKLERIVGQVAGHTATLSALGQAVGGLAAIVPDEERRIEITRALASRLNPPSVPSNPFSDEETARLNLSPQNFTQKAIDNKPVARVVSFP